MEGNLNYVNVHMYSYSGSGSGSGLRSIRDFTFTEVCTAYTIANTGAVC